MQAVMTTINDRSQSESARVEYAVVGLGATGQSVVRFLHARGASMIAFDTRATPPGLELLRAAHPDLEIHTGALDERVLARSAQIVVSPGVPLDEPGLAAARMAGQTILGDIELFARHADAPVIAITGTNGKSTVTTLVAEMLEACGRAVRRGANLGTPVLDLLSDAAPDYYVLELSSFQLDLCSSLAPQVACILNIEPDHLDRHGSFEAYVAAKAKIVERARYVVYNADDAVANALPSPAERVEFTLGPPGPARYGIRDIAGVRWLASAAIDYLAADELHIVGRHNIANALAALAICATCGAERGAMVSALRRFKGLAHRAEYVGSLGGVRFINDSKATNPGAACASIAGVMVGQGGVVIAGGEPKGVGFAHYADVLAAHCHTVVLIGRAAAAIEAAIGGRVRCVFAADMASAVTTAARAAVTGEIVMLSPACASFDMFSDYQARGDAFRAAVAALGAR